MQDHRARERQDAMIIGSPVSVKDIIREIYDACQNITESSDPNRCTNMNTAIALSVHQVDLFDGKPNDIDSDYLYGQYFYAWNLFAVEAERIIDAAWSEGLGKMLEALRGRHSVRIDLEFKVYLDETCALCFAKMFFSPFGKQGTYLVQGWVSEAALPGIFGQPTQTVLGPRTQRKLDDWLNDDIHPCCPGFFIPLLYFAQIGHCAHMRLRQLLLWLKMAWPAERGWTVQEALEAYHRHCLIAQQVCGCEVPHIFTVPKLE